MIRMLHAAIGTTCSKPGDLEENIRQIQWLAEKAQRAGCCLLATPEMSATGYGGYPEVLALAEIPGEGQVYSSLARIAEQTNVVITAGYVERNAQHLHIAHYAIFPDGRYISQRKHRATPAETPLEPGVELVYDGTEEIGHVPAGMEQFQLFTVHGITCVIVVCADLGIRGLSALLQRKGVELMILPVGAGGERRNRLAADELETQEGMRKYQELLQQSSLPQEGVFDSLRYQRATLAVNMNGYDGLQRYHGGSGSIVSAKGQIAAYIPDSHILDYQKPSFACAELNFA